MAHSFYKFFNRIYFKVMLLGFLHSFVNAAVAPITPGQSLWCITQRIGETTDTILDRVNSLLDCACTGSASLTCSPTIISAAVGDVITISIAGNYCLAADLIADISILGNDITLDLNNRSLTGVVSITGRDINVVNGFINPPASVDNSAIPAVVINSVGFVSIDNCVIDCNFNGAPNDATTGRTIVTPSVKTRK